MHVLFVMKKRREEKFEGRVERYVIRVANNGRAVDEEGREGVRATGKKEHSDKGDLPARGLEHCWKI